MQAMKISRTPRFFKPVRQDMPHPPGIVAFRSAKVRSFVERKTTMM